MELQDILFLSLHFTLFKSDLKYLMPGGNRLDILLPNTEPYVVNTITVISRRLNPATNKVINA